MSACKRERVIKDTDHELFRTADELRRARERNVAKWTSDYARRTGRLPSNVNAARPVPEQADPRDDPMHDAWGRAREITAVGTGYVVRSVGGDGLPNTADDIEYRVPCANAER